MLNFYYNSLDKNCKSIIGAVKCGEEIAFTIFTDKVGNCSLLLRKDGEGLATFPMQKIEKGYFVTITVESAGLYFYAFDFGGFYGRNEEYFAEYGKEDWFQLLVHLENYTVPEWIKGGVIYQIFPDRFNRKGDAINPDGKYIHSSWTDEPVWQPNANGKITNDDFFGGNLKGIEEKLPYLKDLGVTTIYLNPIFKAYSNHRYDVGDYMQIDEMLGTDQDFFNLANSAKEQGIKIILDGVFNHTGDDSRYFNKYGHYDEVGAYQSRNSIYHNWYHFTNYPDGYESWWGFKTLPALNKSNQAYLDYITGDGGVLKHYLRLGASGYRLDVVDELPDAFVKKIRTAVKRENADAVIIGEVWENATNKIAYGVRREYFCGEELDSVMNYPLRDAIIKFVTNRDSAPFISVMNEMVDNFPKCALDAQMNILGTHDTERILTALGEKPAATRKEMSKTSLDGKDLEMALNRLKAALVLQFTVSGVPSVYYGDETGMQGYRDPFNRRTFGNVFNEDIFKITKRLAEIRKAVPSFADGEFTFEYTDKTTVVFSRRTETDNVYVAVSLSSSEYYFDFKGTVYNLIDGERFVDRFVLKPYGYAVLYGKNEV